MSSPDFREAIRRRRAELDAQPPLVTARHALLGFLADAGTLEEFRQSYASLTARNPRRLTRDLRALEAVLADPAAGGELVVLVEGYGNWALDDPSEEGARRFLTELVEIMRDVLREHS